MTTQVQNPDKSPDKIIHVYMYEVLHEESLMSFSHYEFCFSYELERHRNTTRFFHPFKKYSQMHKQHKTQGVTNMTAI